MQIQANKIFNPDGNDDLQNRTIIWWSVTWLMNLNNAKYDWAKKMYPMMIGNFWVPEKVKWLGEDSIQYEKELTKFEKDAYDGIISFLTFLDSIQTVNLPHINDYITSPEVNLLISIQTYQEAIHSQSYATILETVVDANKRREIYYLRKNDKFLLERNQYIWWIYQKFIDDSSVDNFFESMIANYLLEWLYFYNWFAFFDTLADQQKMKATQRMINYIRRDELTHVTLFANIFRELKNEFPQIWNEKKIYEMFAEATRQEIIRSHHILWDKIIWINGKNTEIYTKRLANDRLRQIWLSPLFADVEIKDNPYSHLDRLQDTNSEKWNFFETTVTNYTQSSSMKWTWEF